MGIFMTNCSVLLFLSLLFSMKITTVEPDPTSGFIPVPLTEHNFELQKPYDIPLEERYSFINGTRRLWVYADDKPHNPSSHTQPRTEVRIRVCIYTTYLGSFMSTTHKSNMALIKDMFFITLSLALSLESVVHFYEDLTVLD